MKFISKIVALSKILLIGFGVLLISFVMALFGVYIFYIIISVF